MIERTPANTMNPQFDSALQSKQLAALKTLLFDIPLSNETKIQFIKEELSSGRYEIKSTVLARKLVEHAQCTELSEPA